jgi:NADP-dependent 3-hydroxy acid dehydrogenase YdfG
VTLEGRRAVVTGATRGIGAAIARTFDARGARTLLVARDGGALASMAATLRHAAALSLDLSDVRATRRLANDAPGLLGGAVDILVNNAGIFSVADIQDTSDEVLDGVLALNLAAPFRLLRAFLPAMRAQARGDVITIGSVADRVAYRGNAAYAASKFGSRALHEVARTELRGSGVRATLISPGPTDTSLWDAVDTRAKGEFTPRAEMLRPADVADAVLWAVTRPATVNVDELRLSHS